MANIKLRNGQKSCGNVQVNPPMDLDIEDTADLAPKIELSVIVVKPLGPHTLLIGEASGDRFTAQFPSSVKARPDEKADVFLDAGKIHLFRKSDGLAVRLPSAKPVKIAR